MTSLIAWIGIGTSGFNSFYLASDSRISWGGNSTPLVWDCGRKLFASKNYPDILGYCGDVLFPSQILMQVIEHIDSGLLFNPDDTPLAKFQNILSIIKQSFLGYPILSSDTVSIIYCTRQNFFKQQVVYVWNLTWKTGKWNTNLLTLPIRSGLVQALGSGQKTINTFYEKWNRSEIGNTSRNVFSAFCDALKSGEDRRSCGSPQLVGFYREGSAKSFGVIYNNERYLFGLPVNQDAKWEGVEWRNKLFERCDGKFKVILDGTQRHARPNSI
ncbi:hypothetical protein FD724_18565 [Nostoc sp. C057]|uniref:hypothetical protein n=1 Tax=Nostoc sp. C057 TaxID=2576903 RepID=UPI0015C39A23|nr:hypothetical protein [Nostoc sp. C057]QLE49893.1 hypothetical protein FD724_18565 [Nostoc sp. C057]